MKTHLALFGDRLIQQFDIVEKLFVVRLILRHADDVLYTGLEVDIGESRELLHQIHILLIRDVIREQHAVDQQPELAVGELPLEIEVGEDHILLFLAVLIFEDANALAVIDIIAGIDQVHQVAPDCLTVDLHLILAFKNILDLFLTEPMIHIRIHFEDVENVHDDQFFGCFVYIAYTPSADC